MLELQPQSEICRRDIIRKMAVLKSKTNAKKATKNDEAEEESEDDEEDEEDEKDELIRGLRIL